MGDLEESVRPASDAGRRRGGVVGRAACGDQCAHIDVALDHRAVERSEDTLKRRQLLETLNVGFV